MTIHKLNVEQKYEAFKEFWTAYPRKNPVDELHARTVFNLIIRPNGWDTHITLSEHGQKAKVTLQATPEQLIEAAQQYRRSLPIDSDFSFKDEQYIPRAGNWLARGLFVGFLYD